MKDFMFLFRGGLDFAKATPEQIQEAMQNWRAWSEKLTQEGRFGGGNRLVKEGAVISGKKKNLLDGPFTEGKEIVGGFISIKARDLAHAIETAQSCPTFNHDGIIEIREIIPVHN